MFMRMLKLFRSPSMSPLLPLLAATAVGCGGGKEGPATLAGTDDDSGDVATTTLDVTVYELTLRVVLPLNQGNLFDEVQRIDIVISQGGAEVGRYSLEDVVRGELARGGDDLPELADATIAIEGFDGAGAMVAYGKSTAISIADGEEAEAYVFVARIDDFGWLSGLDAGLFGAGLVADGSGDLLLFGGSPAYRSVREVVGDASSAVQRVDLSAAGSGAVFSTVGTMPTFSTVLTDHGRAGHSVTRLGGTHENADLILVAGGSTDFWDQTQTTDQAFLWDPATDTVVDRAITLATPMSRHVAVADSAGNVVLAGGSSQGSTDSTYSTLRAITFVRGDTLEAEAIATGNDERRWVHHAGARYGDRGVLLCGGFDFADDENPDEVLDVCATVSPTGVYTPQAESGITLPQARFLHSMVGLPDGSVLVTGGASIDAGALVVSNSAWLLSPDGIWTEVGPMHMQRALHRMVVLGDGRVLVVGGVTQLDDHWWEGTAAVACAEIFNPELGDFVEAGPCTADALDGDLPEAVSMPEVATDPVTGVAVVIGGLNREEEGGTGVAVFRPPVQ